MYTHPEPVVTNTAEKMTSSAGFLALANRLRSGDNFADINSLAWENYNNEQIDTRWAYQYEANIRELLAAAEENRFNVETVTCKSTACEVKLFLITHNKS